jgi:hypothetical protein
VNTAVALVRISPRNGAYFIWGDRNLDWEDWATPDQFFDCASSVPVAKRAAKQLADGFGAKVTRWSRDGNGWVGLGHPPPETPDDDDEYE